MTVASTLDMLKEYKEKEDKKYWTLRAMETYGGSFAQALSLAAWKADMNNLAKIKSTWPDLWAEYEEIGRGMKNAEKIDGP